MASTILPSGEEISLSPSEIKRYMNPDGVRQLLLGIRKIWNLKVNKDVDFYSVSTLYKYSADVHNLGDHIDIEVRTFSDNGAKAGYAGLHIDGGEFGYIHNHELWNESVSEKSLESKSNRMWAGVTRPKDGILPPYDHDSEAREASILFDSFDGRMYALTNDEMWYVNNDKRDPSTKLPLRTLARIVDIPTKITDLENDLDFVADWNYIHSDNNFSHSNRYILDNIDDRTFVYPEISKDTNGNYLQNMFMGLNGPMSSKYSEGDGANKTNRQTDLFGNVADRNGAAASSYGHNSQLSQNTNGYLPGVFKSVEDLEKVDLFRQKKTAPQNASTPTWKRSDVFYKWDGLFAYNAYDRNHNDESFKGPNQDPNNQYVRTPSDAQPVPYASLNQIGTSFDYNQLYQWRYNRVTVRWWSQDLSILVSAPGRDYHVNDMLRYTFLDEVLYYKVTAVNSSGGITAGEYVPSSADHQFETNPSSNEVPIYFSNYVSTGKGATFIIRCRPRIHVNATQIKNNLYAYVDVVPTVRSSPSNAVPGSSTQNKYYDDSDYLQTNSTNNTYGRSTAAAPAYSGLNKGRGCDGIDMSKANSKSPLAEHGGNATAGVHLHLFRYIVDTSLQPIDVDGVKVYQGKWVDQGPLGVERPADIKALLFSNPDTNNFNNYYKFMIDIFFDNMYRSPDASRYACNTTGALQTYTAGLCRIHVDEKDPVNGDTLQTTSRVFEQSIGSSDNSVSYVDVTDKVLWINGGTRAMFFYNAPGTHKNDPSYGYGEERINAGGKWLPIAGAITK